jgi:hypothetical protein
MNKAYMNCVILKCDKPITTFSCDTISAAFKMANMLDADELVTNYDKAAPLRKDYSAEELSSLGKEE